METEIQFLLKLLLEHKLDAKVKKLCLARIGQVEERLRTSPSSVQVSRPTAHLPGLLSPQAPSTMAMLAKHGGLPDPVVPPQDAPDVILPAQVAATPLASQAINQRQALINAAMSGKTGDASPKLGLPKPGAR